VNPFDYLGSTAARIVAEGWTAAMVSFWTAGLWLLRVVLGFVDDFTTPDVSANGPGAIVYRYTFWMGLALVGILALAQLGVAAFRRDATSLGRVVIGVGQFVVVWAAWVTYAVAVLAAAGGLTEALMTVLLGVDGWATWEPLGDFTTEGITDGTIATVLGIMGLFLVFAAVGHLVVMLTRAGALLVLVAAAPIAAAGLVSDVGRAWFWKSLRWFHAAAFTPVLLVLVLGVGVQFTNGVIVTDTDSVAAAVGTAVPGVILICIACFSPLVLFKLLSFVDPGTSSGAAMRAGLAGVGGLQGLLAGNSSGASSGTTDAASSTDDQGRSQAERAGQDDTSAKAARATQGLLGTAGAALGPVGAAVGAGASMALGAMATVGSKGAVVAADATNQMGVGHNTYVPDVNDRRPGRGFNPQGRGVENQDNDGQQPTTPTPSPPAPTPAAGPAGGAGGAGAASGAEAAAVVPPV